MMNSTVQHSGSKSGKSNVWAHTNLAKTVAALDEFKYGFPSDGLKTVSHKWWGTPDKGRRQDGGGENTEDGGGENTEDGGGENTEDGGGENTEDGGGENTEDGDVKDEAASAKQNSLVAIRKRIAQQGREAVELGLQQGFGSKRQDKKDQALLSQIFKNSMPRVTDSS